MRHAEPDTPACLKGARILIAEDSFLVADDLARMIEGAGAEVIGPFADCAGALAALDGAMAPAAALLDVKLTDGPSYGLAETLKGLGAAVVFTTGYDAGALRPPFDAYPVCPKPAQRERVLSALASALTA